MEESKIHLTESVLDTLILHKVGSKSENEGVLAAKRPFDLSDEDLREFMQTYLLGNFKQDEFFRFNHDTDLNMNEVYTYCSYIFDDVEANFYEQSVHILKHLYEKSEHSKIKSGELYVGYFQNCVVEDELVDAVGIFKAETKDTYIKLTLNEESELVLNREEGTPTAKMDKACLVFNIHREDGYRAITVDLKSSEAKYWRDDFLMLTQLQDENFHTKSYLTLCKDFSKKAFAKEDKNDQVEFLSKSLEYFQTRDTFEVEEFKEEVFAEKPELFDRFEGYQKDYQARQGIQAEESFFISPSAVKKMKRAFKNSIQLDTQMEIKINSPQVQEEGLLERGFDEDRQMHYYKLYFKEEK